MRIVVLGLESVLVEDQSSWILFRNYMSKVQFGKNSVQLAVEDPGFLVLFGVGWGNQAIFGKFPR